MKVETQFSETLHNKKIIFSKELLYTTKHSSGIFGNIQQIKLTKLENCLERISLRTFFLNSPLKPMHTLLEYHFR